MHSVFLLAFGRGFVPIVVSTISIGPQNSFVLRHGVTREKMLAAILTCLACDCILIATGVTVGAVEFRWGGAVLLTLKAAGSAYLLFFGVSYLQAALRGRSAASSDRGVHYGRVVLGAMGVSLLNPLAYVETMFVPAGLGSGLDAHLLPLLAGGAMTGAAVKFCLLGLAALRLTRLFAQPRARGLFDLACGIAMSTIGSFLALTILLPA